MTLPRGTELGPSSRITAPPSANLRSSTPVSVANRRPCKKAAGRSNFYQSRKIPSVVRR